MSDINSMEEFQKAFYPSRVGKICPHCGRKLQEKIGDFVVVVDEKIPDNEIHLTQANGETIIIKNLIP